MKITFLNNFTEKKKGKLFYRATATLPHTISINMQAPLSINFVFVFDAIAILFSRALCCLIMRE